jgi:uncharacterized protein (TIGR00299 family) protein
VKPAERVLFVDASHGASGDMILGALIELGVPAARLRRELAGLPLDGWRLLSRPVRRAGLAARRVEVRLREPQPPRGWTAIRKLLREAALEAAVRRRALEIFRRLIEAEAEVHGTTPGRVHLHEAGGVDAIVDVVGACIGLELLGVERIRVSPMTTGFGEVVCSHGTYPVPAPATLLLVRGLPVRAGEIEAERLTPTGAAILTTVADEWGQLPACRPGRVGHGAGSRELEGSPNCLRMVLAERERLPGGAPPAELTELLVLEYNVDDATPETLAYAAERLREAGALDVFTKAVTMKKGRAGHELTVLGRQEQLGELSRCALRETSTLGLRIRSERRLELARGTTAVRTPYGRVRVKVGTLGGETLQVAAEHDDCAAAARKHDVPLDEVRRAAVDAWRRDGRRRRR